MMPPCGPGWRVSRSQWRAACQIFAASLRLRGANRTGPATLPRHTGHGVRGCGKPDRTAEIESKRASGAAAQPARKLLAPSTLRPWQELGLAKIRGFGEALGRQTNELPRNRTMQTRLSRRVLRF